MSLTSAIPARSFAGISGNTGKTAISLLLGLFISGCSVGPDYLAPEVQVEPVFQSSVEGMDSVHTEIQWWKLFEDPSLHSLIERAVIANKDVKIARARLEESRQLLSEARYGLYPTIRSSGSYNKYQSSLRDQEQIPTNGPIFERRGESFQLGFDATWELDIFGRVQRANEQREAVLEASEAGLRDVIVSLIAEVGSTYAQLRGDQNRYSVARRNSENQRSTLELTQALLDGGQATELDTSRARAQLNYTLAALPPLEATIKNSIFRLSVLLGSQPTALFSELSESKPLPKLPTAIATGDPKSLLQRRPDIRIAERNLAAATAQVGVATADLYPRITFVGNIGYDASSPSDFDSSTETWNFGPGISWAAFDLGRVRAVLKAADASAEASLGEFESTVLRALEETERAFVRFNAARQTRHFLSESAKASSQAAMLANLRYRDGVTDFITVLDAERTMLEAEDRLAQSDTDSTTALIAVYKALGGGWEGFVDPEPVAEQVNSVLP